VGDRTPEQAGSVFESLAVQSQLRCNAGSKVA
jgi:hypothetical protein